MGSVVRRPGSPACHAGGQRGPKRRPPVAHVPHMRLATRRPRRLRDQLLGPLPAPHPGRLRVGSVPPGGRRCRGRGAPRPDHARRPAVDRRGHETLRDAPVDCAVVSDADRLVALLEAKLRPLDTALAEAWWETNTHASPETAERRERIELERRELLGDPDAFGAIEAARRKADEFDPLLARQLDVLHDAFAPHQIDAELRHRIVELEVEVETTFNTFRSEIDGQRVDDNAIADVLRTSDDSATRRAAWNAAKQVGAEVADRVRDLARLRNEAARRLGYRAHFALALATRRVEEGQLFATLDEVDQATAAPFGEWKARLDATLAERF